FIRPKRNMPERTDIASILIGPMNPIDKSKGPCASGGGGRAAKGRPCCFASCKLRSENEVTPGDAARSIKRRYGNPVVKGSSGRNRSVWRTESNLFGHTGRHGRTPGNDDQFLG